MSEQITTHLRSPETCLAPAGPSHSTPSEIILRLSKLSIDFAQVERAPRYTEGCSENDAEHSFMLGLVAPELAERLYPGQLDIGLISRYATAHDLIEVKTGDVATFLLDGISLQDKEQAEQAAVAALLAELPPLTARTVAAYERQADRESRFVRCVDKLLPVAVDILGCGEEVMRDVYAIKTRDELDIAQSSLKKRIADKYGEFPDLITSHALLCDLFSEQFSISQSASLNQTEVSQD